MNMIYYGKAVRNVATPLQMKMLKQIFRYYALNDDDLPRGQIQIAVSEEAIDNEIELLELSGLIEVKDNKLKLTELGRSKFNVVLTGGTYDLVHYGHILTLKEAKSHADFLLVVVARDVTVRARKRPPIHSEKNRQKLLNELEVVDAAVLGDKEDHMRVVRKFKPDVVALGADQEHIKDQLREQINDAGMTNTEIIRLKADYEGLSTSKLIKKILSREWPDLER